MKKILLFTLSFLLFTPTLDAQVTMQGVVLKKFKNHKKGDVIKIYGIRLTIGDNLQFLVDTSSEPIFVNKNKIELLDTPMDFWEKAWVECRGAAVKTTGWNTLKRNLEIEEAIAYYTEAKDDGLIYEDIILYDYVYQLLLKIHPTKLIKPTDNNLSLIIIKSGDKEAISFINGFVILTTGLLANTKDEKELVATLSSCVAQIVLEHKLLVGEEFRKMKKFATISSKIFNSKFKHDYLSEEIFTTKISGTISYSAWQEFNALNYHSSIKLLNRIKTLDLMTARDYLLLAKLYRLTSNSPKSNRKALGFIEKGKKMSFTTIIDFDKEAGLLYLRLDNKEKAKEAFLRYKNGLLDMQKQGEDVAFDLESINHILYKNRML